MDNSAAKWDAVAHNYQKVFQRGQNDYNRSLFAFWQEQGMVKPGDRVLDIGCGVGKYGAMFAALGCDVTLTDISPRMIACARENLAGFNVPYRAEVSDFSKVTGEEDVYAGGFDFSISTMSPAVSTVESIRRMSAMTRGYCFLTYFRSWEQPARDRLLRALGVVPQPEKYGAAEECGRLLAAVREAGYTPQQLVVDYCWQDERSPEEQAGYMLNRYAGALQGVSAAEAERAAAALSGENGLFQDAVNTTVLWLWWKARG